MGLFTFDIRDSELATLVRRVPGWDRVSRGVLGVRDRVADRVWGTPARADRSRRFAKFGGPPLVIAAGLAAYFTLRPIPVPDYEDDPLDELFNFTLLTDEFNKLSIEKRIDLITALVSRVKDMDSSDSVLLASFAAGIMGAAREQLEENASRLAIDLWDKYALDYAKVPDADREQFIDATFIEFTKMTETIGGEPRDISDADRLDEGRRQAERDQKVLSDPDQRPDGEGTAFMFDFMRNDVGGRATPQQRSRGQLLMRDMVRRLRGDEIRSGGG